MGSKKTKLPAVVVRNAAKSYWKGAPVIENLNMTIRQGTIYSLLGSSGCGKSTTLSCIVGLTKFSSGHVWIFGKKPGGGQGVPGKSVGYMPQDYSLHDDFSILETLTYFGMLNGMNKYQIINAIVFYTNLLQLPTEPNRVGCLSGGQKRRLSFAVALIHQPELLILDEPTVGVDPLLRESIWKYLIELSTAKFTTVIITTHYIEETRCSDTIGVMRDGCLIAENSPEALLKQYNTTSLETVVLQLCREGEIARRRTENGSISDIEIGRNIEGPPGSDDHYIPPSSMAIITREQDTVAESFTRIRALIQKYTYAIMRSYMLLMIMIVTPVVTLYITFTVAGMDSHNIPFGVINHELQNTSSSCHDLRQTWNGTCDLNLWSCKFLNSLPSDMLTLKHFHTTNEAENAVKSGKLRGFIQFPVDFSWEFYERAASGLKFDAMRLNDSNIFVRLDQSNSILTQQIQFALYNTLADFAKELVKDCGYNSKKAELPLQYKTPLVRDKGLSYREYAVPGMCISQLFYWPIISTGIRFVNEKRQGTMERSLVAGIHLWEILFAYSVTELVTTIIKLVLMYVVIVWSFEMQVMGSLWLQLVLGCLIGYMGVAAGFLFGSFCTEEFHVAILSLAVFVPNNILSGIVWPIESISVLLQSVTQFLPCTLPSEAARSLTNRGWEFTHPHVWPGFISPFVHMLIYFLLALVISKFKFIK